MNTKLMNSRSGLAACGIMAALAIAGCSSGGSSAPAAGPAATASASATASGASGAAATVVPAASGSASPSWTSLLGPNVTVIPPKPASPGLDSPQALVAGVVEADVAGDLAGFCGYEIPSQQAACKTQAAGVTSGAPKFTDKNFEIGYTVVNGTYALVGTTGTFCNSSQTPPCYTNGDPAAILNGGQTYGNIWDDTINSTSSSNAYALFPCLEYDGKWYVYSSPAS